MCSGERYAAEARAPTDAAIGAYPLMLMMMTMTMMLTMMDGIMEAAPYPRARAAPHVQSLFLPT